MLVSGRVIDQFFLNGKNGMEEESCHGLKLQLYNFAFAKPIPRRFDFYLSFLRGKNIGIYEKTHIYALS